MNPSLRRARPGFAAGWCALAFLFVAARLLAADDGTRFQHQIWQAADGLPSPVVRSLIQDHNGFLWVITPEGLARFDGLHFTTYAIKVGERERSYFALAETPDGSIWASSSNGLARLRNGAVACYTTNDGLSAEYVLCAKATRDGTLWAGCDNGLCRFDGQRFHRLTARMGFIDSAVRALMEDRDGTLWIGTAAGVVEYAHDKPARHYSRLAARNSFHSFCQSRDGTIWAGTTAGLGYFTNGEWTPYTDRNGAGLTSTVRALYEDGGGALWIGSYAGLMRLVDGQLAQVVTAGPIAADFEYTVPGYVYAICGDQEGDIWAGSYGGLNRLTRQPFRVYTKDDGLPRREVTSVAATPEGGMWIGTFGGGLARLENGRATTFGLSNGLPAFVRALWVDGDGSVWLGGEGDDLYHWHNGEVSAHYTRPGDAATNDTYIFTLCRDRAGTLWLGGDKGVTGFRDGKFYPIKHNLRGTRAILEARDGTLWAGFRDGLARIENGAVTMPVRRADLWGAIDALHEDAAGTLWIGTEQGRLFRYQAGRLTRVPTRGAISRIVQILEDGQDRLWIGSDNGIFRLDKKEIASASVSNPAAFSPLPGMQRVECTGMGTPVGGAADGRLCFATMAGLVAIDTAAVSSSNVPPPVTIERVLADGWPVRAGMKFQLPSADSPVEFDFTALSLRSPEDVTFACRLQGEEPDWRVIGAGRSFVYTGLRPGRYTFYARARSGNGAWDSPPAAFSFVLAPHFYQTAGFYALAALALAVLSYVIGRGAIRWRQRLLRQRDDEVFQLIDQWTKHLQQEVAERKEAQRALEESHRFIMRQERQAAVGQLAAGLAHEFNNIMTIVQGHAGLLLDTPGLDEESSASVRHISEGVERMVKLVQQMLAFSRQQVMQTKPVDIKETLAGTEDMLRQLLGDQMKLTIEISPGLPCILADPGMFQQILVNLLVNARDAMSSGGQLTIRAQEVTFTAAEISGQTERKEGRFVKLGVTDTGQGMDNAVIRHLFEPFFTTKDVGKGSGLGLATVYGMINQHKGWIEVASKIGAGTTFNLYFPVTDKVPDRPAAPQSAPAPGGQETILVCEDEEVLRELVREILTGRGYCVLEACNGLQALHEWEQHRGKIDLLLTDISMPEGMSGRDLAAKLRRENPRLPVIFSSGYAQHDSAPPGQSEAFTLYLSKPYRPAQLARTVREALDAGQKQPPLETPAS